MLLGYDAQVKKPISKAAEVPNERNTTLRRKHSLSQPSVAHMWMTTPAPCGLVQGTLGGELAHKSEHSATQVQLFLNSEGVI